MYAKTDPCTNSTVPNNLIQLSLSRLLTMLFHDSLEKHLLHIGAHVSKESFISFESVNINVLHIVFLVKPDPCCEIVYI